MREASAAHLRLIKQLVCNHPLLGLLLAAPAAEGAGERLERPEELGDEPAVAQLDGLVQPRRPLLVEESAPRGRACGKGAPLRVLESGRLERLEDLVKALAF